MESLTRRGFVRSTATVVAGAGIAAATGLKLHGSIREHGPVDLNFMFFAPEPATIKAALLSDESRDLFSISTFDLHQRKMIEVTMPLSAIRKSVAPGGGFTRFPATAIAIEKTEDTTLVAYVKNGDFHIQQDIKDPAPFWMSLKDVQKVL